MNNENNVEKKNYRNDKTIIFIIIGLVLLVGMTFGVTYAFFNYARVGEER